MNATPTLQMQAAFNKYKEKYETMLGLLTQLEAAAKEYVDWYVNLGVASPDKYKELYTQMLKIVNSAGLVRTEACKQCIEPAEKSLSMEPGAGAETLIFLAEDLKACITDITGSLEFIRSILDHEETKALSASAAVI